MNNQPTKIAILIASTLSPFTMAGSLESNAYEPPKETILEVYQLSKDNDPVVLSAIAQRDAAFEAIGVTRARTLPHINLSANYSMASSGLDAVDGSEAAVGLGVNYDLYNRASWSSLSISEMQARQADAMSASSQQYLILRVANAYFTTLAAIDSLRLIESEGAAVELQLEQVKSSHSLGGANVIDLHNVKAQHDEVMSREIQVRLGLLNALESLSEITGERHEFIAPLNTERFYPSIPDVKVSSMVADAEEQNLRLLVSRIERDISRERVALAATGNSPVVSLQGGYGYNEKWGTPTGGAYDAGGGTFQVGVGMNLPVYDGGATSHGVKQAEYAYISSEEDMVMSYRAIKAEVKRSYNTVESSVTRLTALEQALVSSQLSFEATRSGYELGSRTVLDVLDANKRLYEAELNLSNARYDYILGYLKLKYDTGTLHESDLKGLTDK